MKEIYWPEEVRVITDRSVLPANYAFWLVLPRAIQTGIARRVFPLGPKALKKFENKIRTQYIGIKESMKFENYGNHMQCNFVFKTYFN